MTSDAPPALLAIAHGTRDPRGTEELEALLALVRERIGAPAAGAWLEDFAEPDAVTAAATLRELGAERLVTVPLLLLGAGHAKTDVPAAVAAVRAAHPDLPVAHARVLGLHAALVTLARRRVETARRETWGAAGADVPGDEALLLTGAGSSDPDANGDLAKAARFVAETTGHRWVDVAYAGVTWPSAEVALARLRAGGARRVVRFGWSLLAGVLERRIDRAADEAVRAGGVGIADAGRFGPDALVADAVVGRYREAIEGDVRMNCDLCQYRLPLPGREERAGSPSAGGTGARVARGPRAGRRPGR